MTSASGKKWRPFNFFSVQGVPWTGSPMGSDPENRVGDQDFGSPGRPFSSGSQASGEQEQDALGDLPAAFFLQNVLQLHQQR